MRGAVRVRNVGSRDILSGSDGVCYKERPGLTERSSGRRVWGGSGWVGGGGGTHDSMMGWWVMEVLVIVALGSDLYFARVRGHMGSPRTYGRREDEIW